MIFSDFIIAFATVGILFGVFLWVSRKPWHRAHLPDRPSETGRTITDADIIKHHRNLAGAPEQFHHFRRDTRDIVKNTIGEMGPLLPTVQADEPLSDNSKTWHFSLQRNGREMLRDAKAMRLKQRLRRSSVEALAQACEYLLTRCRSGAKLAGQFAESLRLPDPDRLPHMYRLFGPPWKRELTVLWGFHPDRSGTNFAIPVADAIAALRKRTSPDWLPFLRAFILLPCLFLGAMAAVYTSLPSLRNMLVERETRQALAKVEARLPELDSLLAKMTSLRDRRRAEKTSLEQLQTDASSLETEIRKLKAQKQSPAGKGEFLAKMKSQRTKLDETSQQDQAAFQSLGLEVDGFRKYMDTEITPRKSLSTGWSERWQTAETALQKVESAKGEVTKLNDPWPATMSDVGVRLKAIEELLKDNSGEAEEFRDFVANFRIVAQSMTQKFSGVRVAASRILGPKNELPEAVARDTLDDLRKEQARAIGQVIAGAKRFQLDQPEFPKSLAAMLADENLVATARSIFEGKFALTDAGPDSKPKVFELTLKELLQLLNYSN